MPNRRPNFSQKITLIVLTACFSVFSHIAAEAQTNEIRQLASNQTIEREMTGAETHRYKFDLKAIEFFQVRVEQKGVDVALKLLDANGKVLATMDSPNSKNGPEILSYISDTGGSYFFEISGFDEKAEKGAYVIKRGISRKPTLKDKNRIEIEKLFDEIIATRNSMIDDSIMSRNAPHKYVENLRKVWLGWEELQDREFQDLTTATIKEIVKIYKAIGFDEFEKGNSKKTFEFYFTTLGLQKLIADNLEASGTLHDIAKAYLEFGNFSEAKKYFLESLDLAEISKDEGWQAHLLSDLGGLESSLGNYSSALTFNQKALTLAEKINDEGDMALALNNLGEAYTLIGEREKAIQYYTRALPIWDKIQDPYGKSVSLQGLGSNFLYLRNYELAEPVFLESLRLAELLNHSKSKASIFFSLGQLYAFKGEMEKSIYYYQQSIQISLVMNNKFDIASSAGDLMFIYGLNNQTKLAILYGKLSINEYQDLRRSITTLDKLTQKTFLSKIETRYKILAQLLIAQGRIAEAEQVLGMLKEEEYLSYLRRDDKVAADLKARISLSPDEQKAFEEYEKFAGEITKAAEAFGVLEKKKNALALGATLAAADQKEYDRLKAQYDAAVTVFNKFLDDLKVKFGQDNKQVAAVESDTQGLLKRLNQPRTVIISTILGEDRLNLILTTPDVQKAHTVEVRAEEINRLVTEFRAAVRNPQIDPRPLGKKLYDKLFPAALQKDLANIKADTIIWSLDGSLRYMPMAALFDGEKYLVERYTNAVLTLASRDKLGSAARVERQKWLALGVGVSKPFENFNALPAVPKELCSVVDDKQKKEFCKTLGAGVGVIKGLMLADDEFTLAGFQNNLGKTAIVHIASHFSLNAGSEIDSYLLLGGGSERRFSLDNLKKTRLDNVELLTLSACNTAMSAGNNSNGVEIEGFGALAQKQGARAVLATLWAVADDSTKDLMTGFYRTLESGPRIGKAEALRKAQIELLKGKNARKANSTEKRSDIIILDGENDLPPFKPEKDAPYAHPYFWSPFVLIGNWQ